MTDRILSILGVFRRRMVLIRAVEASVIVATASGLSAAIMMGAWTLAGKFTLAAALLCALPLTAGVVLIVTRRLRNALHSERMIQWFVIILLLACGLAGLMCVLTGTYVHLSKNMLFLIFPFCAIFAFVAVLIRPAGLQHVAVLVDKRADLRERFSTALELIESGESDSPFTSAVRNQAIAAADESRLGRVGFWNRTRATGGALGLTTVAIVLMLVVEPLESPSAQQQRRWQSVSGQAGQTLRRQLDAIKANAVSGNPALAEQIRQMEKLAGSLRAAKPANAKRWREKVVELEEIAEALREAIRSDKVDAKTAERIERLIDSLERIATGISEGMSGGEYAKTNDGNGYGRLGREKRGPPSFTPVKGEPISAYAPLTVYNPLYTPLTTTATSDTSPAEVNVQIPYDRAWADACRRANEAMDKETIPVEYRQLIRDFFDTDR